MLKGLNSDEQVEIRDMGVVYREQTKKQKDNTVHILHYIKLFLDFRSINQT